MAAYSSLSLENEVLSAFLFYAIVILLKTLGMSVWTSIYRVTKKVYRNPEDYSGLGIAQPEAITTDPHIERIRRCHQNDLENSVPFVLIGLMYVLTGPQLSTALLHFRVFTGSRIVYTVCYINSVRQPFRGLSFMLGFLVNVSMAITVFRAGSI